MVKFIQGGKMRNLIKNIVDTFGIAIPIAFTYDFLEPILLKNTKTGLILYFVFLIATFFFTFVPKEHLIDENKKNCFEPFLGISIILIAILIFLLGITAMISTSPSITEMHNWFITIVKALNMRNAFILSSILTVIYLIIGIIYTCGKSWLYVFPALLLIVLVLTKFSFSSIISVLCLAYFPFIVLVLIGKAKKNSNSSVPETYKGD
jgi:hypothetical protein